MPNTGKTTTITISRETMRELKKRAIAEDKRFSVYLEELIRNAWDRDMHRRKRVKND
jgi:hypothetical protein